MPITNLIDKRKRQYRFRRINAVIEATWHDNSCQDADIAEHPLPPHDGPSYEEKEHVSLAEAIRWAQAFKENVTLYIYDWDAGIYVMDPQYFGSRMRPTAETHQ